MADDSQLVEGSQGMTRLDLKTGEEIKTFIQYQSWLMVLTTENRIYKCYPTPSGEWVIELVISV